MSALLAMVDEPILYSRPSLLPVDQVAPQHVDIHADLERWGAWNRERYRAAKCRSLEGDYRRTRAGDQGTEYPRLPVWLPPNPRNRQIDRAVLGMLLQHKETVKLFYVERRAPKHICRLVVIHWSDFPKWMFDCRAMVLNQLRFLVA